MNVTEPFLNINKKVPCMGSEFTFRCESTQNVNVEIWCLLSPLHLHQNHETTNSTQQFDTPKQQIYLKEILKSSWRMYGELKNQLVSVRRIHSIFT